MLLAAADEVVVSDFPKLQADACPHCVDGIVTPGVNRYREPIRCEVCGGVGILNVPVCPCPWPPGSEEKVAVLAARYALGVPSLWHPHDLQGMAAVPKRMRRPEPDDDPDDDPEPDTDDDLDSDDEDL
jgi:hypothetical protein